MAKAGQSKKRLGRGLDGLLPAAGAAGAKAASTARIEQLHPNRKQPRQVFDEEPLAELAASIAEHGLLEPILVRKREEGGYEIIAGERRWRAAQKAGLKELPIFVRELTDRTAFEAALVENLQREDLSPIETARAFQRLITEFDYSQEQVASRVGKSRAAVANSMRLLKLPEEVLDMLKDGALSEGHGRALLTAPDEATVTALARLAAKKKLSVREVERKARAAAKGDTGERRDSVAREKSANVKDLEKRLSHALGTPVSVEDRSGKGKLVIEYASYDALDGLLDRLMR